MILPRRRLLIGTAALLATPAGATRSDVATAIAALTKGAPVRHGRVRLDLPLLVENGNVVAMTIDVPDVLPADQRVLSLHAFAEGNPLPHVVNAYFGPRAGRARLSTRIRLATSQTVIAIAACADGSFWSDSVDLLVTLAACVEDI